MPRAKQPELAPRDPFLIACEEWFKELGLHRAWTTDRLLVTCKLLDLTPYQLGALCAVTKPEMNEFMRKGRYPRCLCLHWLILENWFFQVKLGRKPDAPVIPSHFVGQKDKLAPLVEGLEEEDFNPPAPSEEFVSAEELAKTPVNGDDPPKVDFDKLDQPDMETASIGVAETLQRVL